MHGKNHKKGHKAQHFSKSNSQGSAGLIKKVGGQVLHTKCHHGGSFSDMSMGGKYPPKTINPSIG